MKLFLCKIGFHIVISSGLYYLWSRLFRFLFERKYKNTELTKFNYLQELEKALSEMIWTQDLIGGIVDVISSPQKVEYIWKNKDKKVGDCDDFAIYASNRLEEMKFRKVSKFKPYLMTINWLDKDNKFHGHNICLFFNPATKKWGHIGNWFSGKAQMGFGSPVAIALWFAEQGGVGGRLIGYSVVSSNLKGFKESFVF